MFSAFRTHSPTSCAILALSSLDAIELERRGLDFLLAETLALTDCGHEVSMRFSSGGKCHIGTVSPKAMKSSHHVQIK